MLASCSFHRRSVPSAVAAGLLLLATLVLPAASVAQAPAEAATTVELEGVTLEEEIARALEPRPDPGPCSARETTTRDLCQPRVIRTSDRSIDTCLRIQMACWCKGKDALAFLGLADANGQCGGRECAGDVVALRTYGTPAKPSDPRRDCSDPARLGGLEWSIPAPTLEIQHPRRPGSGQGFAIYLVNALPAVPDVCRDPERDKPPNCFHGDNTTNLHFHGFRVSPKKPQDWVFLKLAPGDRPFQYAVDPITELQPPGTHWYHPHKHGSTALQVGNGMAGAFVVNGYVDDAVRGRIPWMRQYVLVVQQIFEDLDHFPEQGGVDQRLWVNGIVNPVVHMAAGEIQWWRIVAAMQKNSSQLVLDLPLPARQLAQDGVPFTKKQYEEQRLDLSAPNALFSPALYGPVAARATAAARAEIDGPGDTPLFHFAAGNRMDVLVRAPTVDRWPSRCAGREWCDFTGIATQVAPELPAEAMLKLADRSNPLVTVRVYRSALPVIPFPDIPERPDYLRLQDVSEGEIGDRKRTVVFSADKGPGNNPQPPLFCIDGNQYDPNRVDHCLEVGTAAEWRLENRAPAGQGLIAHPFHIHTNPFQVWSIGGTAPPEKIWFDTFALPTPSEGAGEMSIRHRFVRFDGEYVLHCHILGHEDRGMMQNVVSFLPGQRCVEGRKAHCDTCPCPRTEAAAAGAARTGPSFLDEPANGPVP